MDFVAFNWVLHVLFIFRQTYIILRIFLENGMSHLFPNTSTTGSEQGTKTVPSVRKVRCSRLPSLRNSLLLIIALFSFLSIWRLLQSPPDFLLTEEQRFVRFTERIFRNEMAGNTLSLHYTLANPADYGISADEVSLGDASAASRKKASAMLENYRNTLSSFDRSKLSSKRQLTYDTFLHYLDTELSGAELYLYDEPLSPTLGIQAQLPVLLAEYTFRTKGDIEDYLCLLTQIPDYFDSILSFERSKSEAGLFMSDSCADEVILQCQQFISDAENNYLITIFNDKIDEISNLTADEKIAYKSRNQSILLGYVIPAYESLISGLVSFQGSGQNEQGLYYLPQGQEYYRYLVKSVTGDDRSVEEIEEEVMVRMVEDFSAIQKLMQNNSSATETSLSNAQSNSATAPTALSQIQPASGSPQLPATVQSSPNPTTMLEDLRQKITQDFPLLPAVSCSVKYVHESLQDHLSPAFYLTPTIDDYDNNVIYINPASDYNNLELYTTLAHEGYPGHLYQSVYFASTEPDLLRYILDVGGYVEGWATYVEIEYAHNFWDSNSSEAAVSRYNRSFTLGLASLLDIGIHYRGYSLSDVENFLTQLGFQSSTAKSLYESILQSPANYLQYYVGYLNFCELRKEQQEKLQGDFSLKEFHKTIMETGPVPFSILKEHL